MTLNINLNNFFELKQNTKNQCGSIPLFDIDRKGYCHVAIDDLSFRMLFKSGIIEDLGHTEGQRYFGINPDFNTPVVLKDDMIKRAIRETKTFICTPHIRSIRKLTPQPTKSSGHKAYGQCLRGISLLQRNLEPFGV